MFLDFSLFLIWDKLNLVLKSNSFRLKQCIILSNLDELEDNLKDVFSLIFLELKKVILMNFEINIFFLNLKKKWI